ncbi:hypothetical protein ULG90_11180 [Halopseudomonas pachastrellae]|nr:hypothetical protein ULG90_11180 [Halopseudomonas pachastrellae]
MQPDLDQNDAFVVEQALKAQNLLHLGGKARNAQLAAALGASAAVVPGAEIKASSPVGGRVRQ